MGGWSGLQKEKEVKEAVGSDTVPSGGGCGGGVDLKHGTVDGEPSHQNMQHSMVPGPYPPGMRRMGGGVVGGPRPVPPWVGRGNMIGISCLILIPIFVSSHLIY